MSGSEETTVEVFDTVVKVEEEETATELGTIEAIEAHCIVMQKKPDNNTYIGVTDDNFGVVVFDFRGNVGESERGNVKVSTTNGFTDFGTMVMDLKGYSVSITVMKNKKARDIVD